MEGLFGVYRFDICRVCMVPIILYSPKTYDDLEKMGVMEWSSPGYRYHKLLHIQCHEMEQIANKVAERLNGNA